MSIKCDIYAKSALDENAIKVKEYIGCDGIEIQLNSDFVSVAKDSKDILNDLKVASFKNHNIYAVHCPFLISERYDFPIEECLGSDFVILESVCKIADYFGKERNRNTLVITHSAIGYNQLLKYNVLYEELLNKVQYLLDTYKNIEICIENIVPILDTNPFMPVLRNNYFNSSVLLVKDIRKKLNTDRVGTVLDICHAKMSKLEIELFYNHVKLNYDKIDFSLNSFFRENKDVIKLFHLSDMLSSGFGNGHGIFVGKKAIGEFVSLYNDYNLTCPVTLEVREDDFSTCSNYKYSKGMFDLFRS